MFEHQKVYTRWTSINKQHFVNKGYVFTEMHSPVEVWSYDLKDSSKVLVSITCDNCGKQRQKPYYSVVNRKNHFCDYRCMGKWNSENKCGENNSLYRSIKKICEYCSQEYTIKKFRETTSRFCSPLCRQRSALKRIIIPCALCGTKVERTPISTC